MRAPSFVPRVPGRLVARLVTVVLAVLAAVGLHRQLQGYPWDRLGPDVAALGAARTMLAVAATIASYVALTGYDALALRYVEHPMPYRRYAAASFVATAFGNSLGASAVVGAALRARVYSAWAVPGFAVTRIIGLNLVTLALGWATLAGAGALAEPGAVGHAVRLPPGAVRAAGLLLLVAVAGYVAWCGAGRRALTVRDWRIDRPSRPLALAQVALSVTEWLAMAAVLFVLLPDGAGSDFWSFAPVFAVATLAGLVSNVPGGLGVFESVILLAVGRQVPSEQLVTALVVYRLVYFLGPLVLAAAVLAVLERARDQQVDAPVRGRLVDRVGVLTPSVLALAVGGLGLLLVVTGDAPGDARVPDMTAFTASLAGLLLLLLARGLQRRLHGAWWLSLALLATVMTTAVTHRALVLAATAAGLAGLLMLARGAFHRRTSVLADARGWGWAVTVTASVSMLVWWHDLWVGQTLVGGRTVLEASSAAGAPGHVRAGLALGVLGVVVGGSRLQTPGRGVVTATPDELRRAEPVMARSTHGNASLLWTGDKRILFSSGGNALLMYQVRRRSWVAMSDPVGDPREFDDLVARFLEEADARCGRPVLYSVRADLAPLYRRHGLALGKLGEEATVPLADFTMQGKARSKLRSECRASERAGVVVEVVEAADAAALLPELRVLSDAWLAERNVREKRFSLGAFDEDFVRRFPVVVARQGGRIVAFATLWASGARHEVKVDLMRRLGDAPRTVMSHLFVEAMTWSRDAGYASFSLGMAPLSGLRTEGTGTFWDRAGQFLWTHGEHFYNFQGLRQFKERFDPVWETRYVASYAGPALPVVMMDVATLVGGGLRGVVAR